MIDQSSVPVVLAHLNGKIRGFTTLGSDFEPIIVLNEQLSPQQKRKTYNHEIHHLQSGEFWDDSYDEYGGRP